MVKRYTFDEGDEAYYDREGFLPPHYQDVVLAADYDALAADLAECREALSETCEALAVEHTAVEKLEAASIELLNAWDRSWGAHGSDLCMQAFMEATGLTLSTSENGPKP